MASATGIPQENPATQGSAENEPLLGRAGDASQQDGKPIAWNFVLGTAIIAQAGIWIVRFPPPPPPPLPPTPASHPTPEALKYLYHDHHPQLTATIWASVFIHPLILFSAHPLLNSAGLLLTTQAILLLQPTHSPSQKRTGTHIHAVLNSTSILALLAALIIIEYNKIAHSGAHFESPHAILGLITYILFGLQAVVGLTQFYAPGLYGGVDRAKSVYKYHRMSGYVLLVLSFCTVAAATQTGFNMGVLHIQLWAVIVASLLVLVGLLPRIRKGKFGLK